MGLTVIQIALIIVSAIQFAGQAVVFGAVYLNVVFTWSQLPISSVSYYDSSATWAWLSDRYNIEWILMLLDVFDIWIPAVIYLGNLMMLKGRTSFKYIITYYIVGSFGVNIAKLVFRLIETSFCATFGQLCRSTDPTYHYTFFVTNNPLWLTLISYNGLFIFWDILYFILTSKMIENIEKERESMLEDWLRAHGISQPAVYAFLNDPGFLTSAFYIYHENRDKILSEMQKVQPVQSREFVQAVQPQNYPRQEVLPPTILNPNQAVMPPEEDILPPYREEKSNVNLNLPYSPDPYGAKIELKHRKNRKKRL